jgi:SP family sugar:H+ symporter-like MFS transporter
MTFPVLLASIGLASAYGIYAAFAAISIIFVIKFVRETKGMELEDMEELHQRSPVDEAKTALV